MKTRLAMGRGRGKGPRAGAQHGKAWYTGPSPSPQEALEHKTHKT